MFKVQATYLNLRSGTSRTVWINKLFKTWEDAEKCAEQHAYVCKPDGVNAVGECRTVVLCVSELSACHDFKRMG